MTNEQAYRQLLASNFDFPWIGQPGSALDRLCAGAEMLHYRKGDMVLDDSYTGESLYVVHSGRVINYFVTPKGHQKAVCVFAPGALIGDLNAIDRQSDGYLSQVCSQQASLYRIPAARFLRALEGDADIRMAVYRSLASKARVLARQIEYSVCTAAVSKIAYLLLSTCKRYGAPCEGGYRLEVSLTHSEIAHICGISRVSASNNIQKLRACGAVGVCDGHLALLDIGQLMDLVR